MPSLSINNKDLESLGINLKDLLKAIAHTKSSPDDVIKIKKRKAKNKKGKKRVIKSMSTSGMSKIPNLNPFPVQQPKFNSFIPVAGGGGVFPTQTRIEVKSEPQTQQQRQDETTKLQMAQLENQIVTQKKQLDQQINDIQQQQQIQYQGMNLTNQGVAYLIKNQQNPLLYHPYNTPFREPVINRNDRFGVVSKNDFYENARTNEGLGIEVLDAEPIFTEPQDETDTSIFQNVPSEAEQQPQDQEQPEEKTQEPTTPNVDMLDIYQQQTPRQFTTPLKQGVQDDTEEPLDLAQTLEQAKKGRGQRGKDKAPRQRKTKVQIGEEVSHNTRSKNNPLVEGTNNEISPYSLAKQQNILNFYQKPNPIAKRKSKKNEDNQENQDDPDLSQTFA